MADQLPALIVLTPLFAALLVFLLGQWRASFAFPITILGLGLTVWFTLMMWQVVHGAEGSRIEYFMGGLAPVGQIPIGIHLVVDRLSSVVLIVIALVAFLAGVFSLVRVPEESPDKIPAFYALYLLLTTGLLGQTITADAFNVYVLLEVSSLTSYALIAMGQSKRGTVASFHYVIMGTIGASFYLLGVGYLYAKTGSLNMDHIRSIIDAGGDEMLNSSSIRVAFSLIILGLWTKMAFFPLHGWLANAYSYSPATSTCILAPLVTKVTVYIMIRMVMTVFGVDFVLNLDWHNIIVWMAVIAIIAGSVMALSQKEFKRMLCYLIVAEVGYMVGGFWLANEDGFSQWGQIGTTYHILSDALMTLTLFIGASIVWRHSQSHSLNSFDGLFKKMPITMVGLLVGAFAMIGIPPTCGFFSKWFLIRGGIETGHWEYVVALLISSLVNAVLFFRIIEIAFFGKKPAEGHSHHDDHGSEKTSWSEAPPLALVALLASAACVILLGVFNAQVVKFIQPFFS